MAEQISPSDLSLFLKAQKAMEQAQTMAQFAQSHISEVYQLKPDDRVDTATGLITRAAQPE